MHCFAFGCNITQKGLSFHNFPHKNPGLLKLWLAKLNRKAIPNKYSKLCGEHFEVECFEEDLYDKYVGRS